MDLQTAQRLFEYRKANGYSQEELAEKIGVSRQAISKWERSESSPDTDNLIALAKLYGITIDELINGSSTPQAASEPAAEAEAEQAAPEAQSINQSPQNGTYYAPAETAAVNPPQAEQKKKSSPLFEAIIGCAGLLLFLLTGFLIPGGWAYSWLFLLMIPIIITAVEASRANNPNIFCYPVLMVVLYCGLGLCAHIWHPTWILFITIPFYYILADAYRKSRKSAPAQGATANGTYYTPNTQTSSAYAQEQGSSKAAQITLGILLCLLIAGVLAAALIAAGAGAFSFIPSSSGGGADKEYAAGAGEVAASSVNSLEIDWVNGNIDIEYYDGSTISFTETETASPDEQLRYKLDENGKLRINFCRETVINGIKGFNLNTLSKDLTIYIPQGLSLKEIEIDSVSSETKINAITASELEIDSVSGNAEISGSFDRISMDSVSGNATVTADSALKKFSVDSVSGDVALLLPEDIPGFTVSSDSVSGNINISGFAEDSAPNIGNGNIKFGNGQVNIELDSMSGNLTIQSY